MQCPNCEDECERTGNPTAANTAEVSCPSCWWISNRTVPFLAPEHQGQELSLGAARKLAEEGQ